MPGKFPRISLVLYKRQDCVLIGRLRDLGLREVKVLSQGHTAVWHQADSRARAFNCYAWKLTF